MPTISLTALNVLTIDSAGLTSLKTFLTAQLPPPSSREEKRREEKRTISGRIQDQINNLLDSHEKIAGALIAKDSWSSENGYLTHTLKIKRASIEKNYQTLVEKAFDNGASTSTPLITWE